jgi:hypothetical protein
MTTRVKEQRVDLITTAENPVSPHNAVWLGILFPLTWLAEKAAFERGFFLAQSMVKCGIDEDACNRRAVVQVANRTVWYYVSLHMTVG